MKKFLVYFVFETAFIFVVGCVAARILGIAVETGSMLLTAAIAGAVIAGVMARFSHGRCPVKGGE